MRCYIAESACSADPNASGNTRLHHFLSDTLAHQDLPEQLFGFSQTHLSRQGCTKLSQGAGANRPRHLAGHCVLCSVT
jgi:hypothetical protein